MISSWPCLAAKSKGVFRLRSLGSSSTLLLAHNNLTAIKFPDIQAGGRIALNTIYWIKDKIQITIIPKCNGDEPKLSGICGSNPEYTNICISDG